MRWFVLLLLALPAFAQDAPVEVEGKHYQLRAEAPRETAEEYGRLLDAAYPRFKKFFRGKPKGKLVLHLQKAEPATLYDPESGIAYAQLADTAYVTRVAILRSAARQYHLIVRARKKLPTADWYAEGIADFLAAHYWDGERLEMGIVPLLSYEDFAGKAVQEMQATEFDLTRAVGEAGVMSRPVGWTLVRFLMQGEKNKPHPKWGAFVKKMDGGVAPAKSFVRHFGKPADLQRPLLLWADRRQEPFAPIHSGWEPIAPDALRATSRGLSACRLKGNVRHLEVTLEPPREKRRWVAGVLLHADGKNDFSVALFDWGGHIRVHRYVNGSRQILAQGAGPGVDDEGRYKLQAFRSAKGVFFALGALSYGPYDLPGQTLGLAIERCTFTFREVRWK